MDIARTMSVEHVLGLHADNTIGALKKKLEVDALDCVLLTSYMEFLVRLDDDRPPLSQRGPDERVH